MKILPVNYTFNNRQGYDCNAKYIAGNFALESDKFEKSPAFKGKILKSEINAVQKSFHKFLKQNNPINEKLIEINTKYVGAKNNIANANQKLHDIAEEIYRSSYITALFGDYKNCIVSRRSINANDAYNQMRELYGKLPADLKVKFADDFNALKGLFSVRDDIIFERDVKNSLDALRTNLNNSLEKYNIRNKAGELFVKEEKLIDIAESKSRKLIDGIYFPQNEIEEFMQKYSNPDFDFHGAKDSINKKISYYETYSNLIKEFISYEKKNSVIEKSQKRMLNAYKICERGITDNAKPAVKQVSRSTIKYKSDTFSRKVLNILDSQEVSLREFIQKFRNEGIEIPENIKNY